MTDTLRKAAEQAREALNRVPHLRVDADTSDAITDALAVLDAALAAEGERHLTLDEQQVMHSALRKSATVVEAALSDAELVKPARRVLTDEERRDQQEAFFGGYGDDVFD